MFSQWGISKVTFVFLTYANLLTHIEFILNVIMVIWTANEKSLEKLSNHWVEGGSYVYSEVEFTGQMKLASLHRGNVNAVWEKISYSFFKGRSRHIRRGSGEGGNRILQIMYQLNSTLRGSRRQWLNSKKVWHQSGVKRTQWRVYQHK